MEPWIDNKRSKKQPISIANTFLLKSSLSNLAVMKI